MTDETTPMEPGSDPRPTPMERSAAMRTGLTRMGRPERGFVNPPVMRGSTVTFDTLEECAAELKLCKMVIQHLIKKELTLLVIAEGLTPEPLTGEEAEDEGRKAKYEAELRKHLDSRVLAVNPNFGTELG